MKHHPKNVCKLTKIVINIDMTSWRSGLFLSVRPNLDLRITHKFPFEGKLFLKAKKRPA